MQIEKTSEKYNFYQEGANFVIDMGEVKRAEAKEVALLITEVEDFTKLKLKPKCGCTTTENVITSEGLNVKLAYTQCDLDFNKVVVVEYSGVKVGTILIKGRCQ